MKTKRRNIPENKKCSCKKEWLKHLDNTNDLPNGSNLEFDRCSKCGKIHNFKTN